MLLILLEPKRHFGPRGFKDPGDFATAVVLVVEHNRVQPPRHATRPIPFCFPLERRKFKGFLGRQT